MNRLLQSFFIATIFLFSAHASFADTTCSSLYIQAAAALDEKRAECGLPPPGNGTPVQPATLFCSTVASIEIPIGIDGVNFQVSIGEVYRLLNSLNILPNQFRRVARLISEAYAGQGMLLTTVHRRVARIIPGVSTAQLANIIVDEDKSGGLCGNQTLTNIRGIQQILEEKFTTTIVAK